MKKTGLALLLTILASAAFAQSPDPRDSIILESKTVYPGAHPGSGTDTAAYVYVRMSITNKDTLAFVTVGFIETSISGGAYMTLARPRNYSGMIRPLTTTLQAQKVFSTSKYRSNSPDTFYFAGGFNPEDDLTKEPPNAVRKALWEIKFDTVFNNTGTIEFNSTSNWGASITPGFTNTEPVDYRANFLKAVITVERKGDLNVDGIVSPADVVLELNCVYLGSVPPAGYSKCDVNCDGEVTPADVAVFLNYKFVTLVWPC
ncbi:MAG: dockerin type I repeat-containing protein [Candidatus Zixiibacteriota bacterium]